MSRTFTREHIYSLDLHRYLTDSDGEQIAHYLSKNAPASAARWFKPGTYHHIKDVLHQADQSALTIDLVVAAIESTGKLKVANTLRAMVRAPRAEDFLNAPGRLALIERTVLDDQAFHSFCMALELPPNDALALRHERVTRCYLALRSWLNLAWRQSLPSKACWRRQRRRRRRH